MLIKAKKCIPSLVSLVRPILAPFVFLAATSGRWQEAFWLFAISLLSDYLDGLLAIALDAKTVWGKRIDRAADFSMTLSGLAGIVGAQEFSPFAPAIISGALSCLPISFAATFLSPEKHWLCRTAKAISPLIFLALMIAVGTCYAVMGIGMETTKWLLLACALISPFAIWQKRHRFQAWLGI